MSLKNRIKNGEIVIGGWLQSSSAEIAGIMAKCGFDWIAVDLEHGSIAICQLPEIFNSIKLNGSVPVARVKNSEELSIRQALDAGAEGVIVPMVSDEETARKIISSIYYPPKGRRGIGFCTANLYGMDFDNYLNSWNDSCFLIAQIENIEGVEHCNAIFSQSGIDGYMIGPYDLSGSLGEVGNFKSSKYKKALEQVQKVAKKHSCAAGLHIVMPNTENVKNAIKNGYSFIAYGIDTVAIWKLFQEDIALIKSEIGHENFCI